MTATLDYRFIHDLKALPCVKAVYLFGSRARGDGGPRSDIDLAIQLNAHREPNDWRKVVDIIEGADTLLEIDCVDLDHADEALRARILSQGKLL